MMAVAAQNEPTDYVCPMIDARRMEVFASVFDKELNTLVPPSNVILTENSFKEILEKYSITFFGNGSDKFQSLINHPNAVFKTFDITALLMVSLSYKKFIRHNFANLAYSEPFYGKDFHSLTK
jgi:tRNA threonylcarbamoyladenosine biosynthesis protein TsaB